MNRIVLVILLFMMLSACGSKDNLEQRKLIHSSNHFEFYYFTSDDSSVLELSEMLENNYDRITTDLHVSCKEKVRVVVYPSVEEFHKRIGRENLPDWAVAMSGNNSISMVSPSNPGNVKTKQDLLNASVHEFTHVAINWINPSNDLPSWLDEGVAGYEAKDMDEKHKEELKAIILEGSTPKLSTLEKVSNEFLEVKGYWVSQTVIDFIVSEYGYDKLIDLIKNPSDFIGIFGMNRNEFEQKWISFFKERYCK